MKTLSDKQLAKMAIEQLKKSVEFKKTICVKCDYKWIPRKEKPRQCPNCKRQIKYK